MKKISIALVVTVIICGLFTGCRVTQPESAPQTLPDIYSFCIANNGTVLSNPGQCVYQKLVYFQETGNAMNIQFCTSYYDGCNTCKVDNGTIRGCTKINCASEGTPRCLVFNETHSQGAPFTPSASAEFACAEGHIYVVFDNAAHTANLTLDGWTTLLPQVISADGIAYSNQNITFSARGEQASVYNARNRSQMLFTGCTAGD